MPGAIKELPSQIQIQMKQTWTGGSPHILFFTSDGEGYGEYGSGPMQRE